MIITKVKNKSQFKAKDGIINYLINLEPSLTCQCGGKLDSMCKHMKYLLSSTYYLSDFSINYFNHIYDIFLLNSYSDNLNEIVEKEIVNKFQNDNCGICLSSLSSNMDLSQCSSCRKYGHRKCMDKWLIKSPDCIYCKSKY
jgi:hypothetical protein